MTPTQEALLIGTGAVAVALLAVFDVIPATIAQIVPLAMLPFIARRKACTLKAC